MAKIKCSVCKNKINSMMKSIHTCRCTMIYCHIHLQDHNCTFNYKEQYAQTKGKELMDNKENKKELFGLA